MRPLNITNNNRPPVNQNTLSGNSKRAEGIINNNNNHNENKTLDSLNIRKNGEGKAAQGTKKAGFLKKIGSWLKTRPTWAKYTGAAVGVVAAGVAGYELVKRNANKK